MLFEERKRLQAIEEAERAGGSFWTTQFRLAVRTKIKLVLADCSTDLLSIGFAV
jgi:hypothetical protein